MLDFLNGKTKNIQLTLIGIYTTLLLFFNPRSSSYGMNYSLGIIMAIALLYTSLVHDNIMTKLSLALYAGLNIFKFMNITTSIQWWSVYDGFAIASMLSFIMQE